jgi:hypothetical protein
MPCKGTLRAQQISMPEVRTCIELYYWISITHDF